MTASSFVTSSDASVSPGTRFQQGARKIGLVGTCCSHRCAEVAKLVADCGADVAGPADHHGMKAGGKRKA
ncbi:hypothetical protein ACVWWR_006280 [Bradyrhizobium sp. LM3.2]